MNSTAGDSVRPPYVAPLATLIALAAALLVVAGLRAAIAWANQIPNTVESFQAWRGVLEPLSRGGLSVLAVLVFGALVWRYPPLRGWDVAAIAVFLGSFFVRLVPLLGQVVGGAGLLMIAGLYGFVLLRGLLDLWRPHPRHRPRLLALALVALATTLALFVYVVSEKLLALAWSQAID